MVWMRCRAFYSMSCPFVTCSWLHGTWGVCVCYLSCVKAHGSYVIRECEPSLSYCHPIGCQWYDCTQLPWFCKRMLCVFVVGHFVLKPYAPCVDVLSLGAKNSAGSVTMLPARFIPLHRAGLGNRPRGEARHGAHWSDVSGMEGFQEDLKPSVFPCSGTQPKRPEVTGEVERGLDHWLPSSPGSFRSRQEGGTCPSFV